MSIVQVQCLCAACNHLVVLRAAQDKGDARADVIYVQNEVGALCQSCAEWRSSELRHLRLLEEQKQPLRRCERAQLEFFKRQLAYRPIPEATRQTSVSFVYGDTSIPRGALAMYNSADAQRCYEWLREAGWVVETDHTHPYQKRNQKGEGEC